MTQPADENPLDFRATQSNVSIVKQEKPMPDSTTFSTRSNAKRAAEKAIRDGTAPSIDYGIKPTNTDHYRFEIVWRTDQEAEESATNVLDDYEPPTATESQPVTEAAIDRPPEEADLEGGSEELNGAVANTDAPLPEPKGKPERKPRAASSGNRAPSKSVELNAAAARGEMPTKPIITSKANPHYQKRFDQLEDWAMAGNWDAVRGYEVKGINSYAKMVIAYRDRLLTAHAAQQAPKSEAA